LSFASAVKYNKAQAKKEAALKAKEEAKKKKEEEEKMVSKVITTIRKSQANLKAMNTGMVITDDFLSGKTRTARTTRPERTERDRRERPKKEVTSLVDDILSNNPAFSNRPRRNMRDQDGQVKQLSKALRNSRTFTKLRENRDAQAADKGQTKEVSQTTKQALQRQLSTKLPRSRA